MRQRGSKAIQGICLGIVILFAGCGAEPEVTIPLVVPEKIMIEDKEQGQAEKQPDSAIFCSQRMQRQSA